MYTNSDDDDGHENNEDDEYDQDVMKRRIKIVTLYQKQK